MCLLAGTCGTGEAADCTVMLAVPDLAGLAVLVAVTVSAPEAAGAVTSPAEDTVPALTAQVTLGMKLPAPCTVAVH